MTCPAERRWTHRPGRGEVQIIDQVCTYENPDHAGPHDWWKAAPTTRTDRSRSRR